MPSHIHLLIRTSNRPLADLMRESFGRNASEAGMERQDADLKINDNTFKRTFSTDSLDDSCEVIAISEHIFYPMGKLFVDNTFFSFYFLP